VELHTIDITATSEVIAVGTVARATSHDVSTTTIAAVTFELVDKSAGAQGNSAVRVSNLAAIATTIATTLGERSAICAVTLKLVDKSAGAEAKVADPGAGWAPHIHGVAAASAVSRSVNVDRCVLVRVVGVVAVGAVAVRDVDVVAVRDVDVVSVRDVEVVAVRDVEVVAVRVMGVRDVPVAATATAASPLGLSVSGLRGLKVLAGLIVEIVDGHSSGEQHKAERQKRNHGELHV
jgi:hypothetical protein